MKDIKLYGAFHTEFPKPLDCEWLLPIAVGEKAPRIYGSDLRDSDGINISYLNPYYCELTAQYWVRHNRPSQYVGFYHYRRYFSFIRAGGDYENAASPPCDTIFNFLSRTSQYTQLERLLDVYDVVVPGYNFNISVEEQYVTNHDPSTWNVFLGVLESDFPKYTSFLEYFRVTCQFPIWNMFVMPWQLFCNYFDELFLVLDKVCKVAGLNKSGYEKRYPGLLAERFLGLYLLANRITSYKAQMVMIDDQLNLNAVVQK